MEYVLKTKEEIDRLQTQNNSDGYSVATELEGFTFSDNSTVLDIGCGAGTLTEYLLSNFNIQSHACDLVEDHVEFCKEKFKNKSTVFQHDILEAPTKEKYDYIVMRYVPHHLGEEMFIRAAKNMKASLNIDGQLVIIDIDGMFRNLGTVNKELRGYIDTLVEKFSGDFLIGRKIASILNGLNFGCIRNNIQLVDLGLNQRELEVEQMKERFRLASDGLVQIFQDEKKNRRFTELFIEELEQETTSYHVTKFIVSAVNS